MFFLTCSRVLFRIIAKVTSFEYLAATTILLFDVCTVPYIFSSLLVSIQIAVIVRFCGEEKFQISLVLSNSCNKFSAIRQDSLLPLVAAIYLLNGAI